MAASLNTLFAIVILSLLGKGFCQCELRNITVTQTDTGGAIHGKSEYKVTVTNNCICSQYDVKLNTEGFSTTLEADPLIFNKETGLVKNGEPLYPHESIKFNYAWDTRFSLNPVSSRVACS
ncbi:hypothetical protein BVC80_9041g47 [Macleaya cordata]|uniref:Uncharacterized protein n=1 Tax=Macleaya cordata TaxID=56857 RepID=A0A200R2V4_MACCD|nr:hypothetical protein BVC80_9041g47 [Macleaya cordata]